jgi:hypothetical protein
MKRIHLVLVTLTVTIVSIGIFKSQTVIFAQQAKGQAEKNVTFQWAFGAIRNTDNGPQFEAITRDTVMKSGDQIKFFLRVENKCFVYLIYQSSQGDLSVLFPYRFKLLDNDYQISRNYYIPKGDQWFELDEYTGTEKFYLLATANRLAELEDLINEYESADKSNKITIGEKIISETRRLRKKHHKFKSHVERPVTIIGKMRGTEKTKAAGLEDIADYALEISANNLFSRTFTIDHQ